MGIERTEWSAMDRAAWALLREGRLREAVLQWQELAQALRRVGRLEDARGIGRTLVDATRDASPRLQLIALDCLAAAARESGDLTEAERCLEGARALHERLGDERSVACDLVSLGEIAEDGGDLERAVDLWNRAAVLLDVTTSPEAVHDLCLDLSRGYTALGDPIVAAACARRAEQLAAAWAE